MSTAQPEHMLPLRVNQPERTLRNIAVPCTLNPVSLADQPTSAPAPPAKRGRRADAERNRATIIEAATAVFAEHGGGVDCHRDGSARAEASLVRHGTGEDAQQAD